MTDERRQTRRLWHLLETIHAITYFAPEPTDAYRALGLKGFWMGYFASRVAPMGPIGSELGAAVLFGFRPSMVARTLPSVWATTSPEAVIEARTRGVEAALSRILGAALGASEVAEAAVLAEEALPGCSAAGRPLFAAYSTLPRPSTAVGRLWRAATLLREHRGDGHVAAMVAQGDDGLDGHVLFAATGAVDRSTLQPNRGWTDDEWQGCEQRLSERGLLHAGRLTEMGRRHRHQVEDATDDVAAEPWRHLGVEATDRLARLVTPLVDALLDSGTLPFPNPIGLPAGADREPDR